MISFVASAFTVTAMSCDDSARPEDQKSIQAAPQNRQCVTYPSATIIPEISCWQPNHSDVLIDFGPVADAPITP